VFGRFYGALGLEPSLSRRPAWAAWLWNQPLVVDDARIRRARGVRATPWEVAVRETLAWALDACR
jgi:hypothetical protein